MTTKEYIALITSEQNDLLISAIDSNPEHFTGKVYDKLYDCSVANNNQIILERLIKLSNSNMFNHSKKEKSTLTKMYNYVLGRSQ